MKAPRSQGELADGQNRLMAINPMMGQHVDRHQHDVESTLLLSLHRNASVGAPSPAWLVLLNESSVLRQSRCDPLHAAAAGREGGDPMTSIFSPLRSKRVSRMLRQALLILALMSVVAIAHTSASAARLEIIHTFSSDAAGWAPLGELIADENHVIYGTTQAGGKACPTGRFSCGGTVYSLTPPATGERRWTHTILHSFKGGADGASPVAGVIVRWDNGVIHGTTEYGGLSCSEEPHGWGCGTVFELLPPTDTQRRWAYRVLHRFRGGADGRFPTTRLIQLKDGTYFGSTESGGRLGNGSIFRMSEPVGPAWGATSGIPASYSSYYDRFFGSIVGLNPHSLADVVRFAWWYNSIQPDKSPVLPPAVVSNPPLYGFAEFGGDDGCVSSPNGCGTIFEITATDSNSPRPKLKVLHSFVGGLRGAYPNEGATIGPDVNNLTLYGTAFGGHDCPSVSHLGCGIVFRYVVASRSYEILYRFKGGSDGAWPIGHVAIDGDGNVYGATQYGGGCTLDDRGCGIVYQLSPPSEPGRLWRRTILHAFSGEADGKWPSSGILRVGRKFYGITASTVYAVTP